MEIVLHRFLSITIFRGVLSVYASSWLFNHLLFKYGVRAILRNFCLTLHGHLIAFISIMQFNHYYSYLFLDYRYFWMALLDVYVNMLTIILHKVPKSIIICRLWKRGCFSNATWSLLFLYCYVTNYILHCTLATILLWVHRHYRFVLPGILSLSFLSFYRDCYKPR